MSWNSKRYEKSLKDTKKFQKGENKFPKDSSIL